MASNVYVNVETIDKFSTDLKGEAASLNSILSDLITMTMDMEKFFDTPTAKIMRDSLINYLNDSITTCNLLDTIGENVSKSKSIYETAINNIDSSTRG